MSTIATGGFSTHDHLADGLWQRRASGRHRPSCWPAPCRFFAILRALAARDIRKAYDAQIPVLLTLVVIFSLLAFLEGRDNAGLGGAAEVMVEATFSVVAVITTTGLASVDYLTWGPFAAGLFYAISFFGGCTGSTSGGAKSFRIIMMVKGLNQSLKETDFFRARSRPSNIWAKQVPDTVVRSVGLFPFRLSGGDRFGHGGAVGDRTRHGPRRPRRRCRRWPMSARDRARLIGPSGNYASLPDVAKWILSFSHDPRAPRHHDSAGSDHPDLLAGLRRGPRARALRLVLGPPGIP